jgi:GAF domain-containing protein
MVTMLSALSELGVAFSAARERRGLGRLVAFTAATVLESDVATVRILRDDVPPGATDVELFELLAAHGASPGGADDPLSELEERVAREVVGRRAGVTDTDLPAREAESLLTRSNVKSLLAIPMLSDDDELLGVVVVYRVADAKGRDSSYGDPEREIAARLGDYAAAAAQRFSTHGGSPEIE